MNKYIILILIMISILGIIVCNNTHSNDYNIELIAVDSVATNLDVNVELIIYNNSKNDMIIYQWQHNRSITAAINSFLFFDIENEQGEKLVYDYIGPRPKLPYKNDYYLIKSGEKYSELINLTSFYIDKNRINQKDEINYPKRKYNSGTYTIQCRYEYKHKESWSGGASLWEGQIISNEIKIRVI